VPRHPSGPGRNGPALLLNQPQHGLPLGVQQAPAPRPDVDRRARQQGPRRQAARQDLGELARRQVLVARRQAMAAGNRQQRAVGPAQLPAALVADTQQHQAQALVVQPPVEAVGALVATPRGRLLGQHPALAERLEQGRGVEGVGDLEGVLDLHGPPSDRAVRAPGPVPVSG